MQALLLSRYMDSEYKAKIMEMYVEKEYCDDPYYSLLLINDGSIDKLFELQQENIINSWPKHLSFLLKNSKLCKRDKMTPFINALSTYMKQVS